MNKKIIIIIVVVVLLVGGIGAFVISKLTEDKSTGVKEMDLMGGVNQWKNNCVGNGKVMMTHLPTDMNLIGLIQPMGILAAAHVTPIDHLYFYPKDLTVRHIAPVYALADGYVVEIEDRGLNLVDGKSESGAIRIVFQYNCDTYSYYDLMTSIDPQILAEYKKGNAHIPVKSGQEIGRVGQQSLDTAIYNFAMTLPGFINPQTYIGEAWKVHTDDFYAYFSDADQALMLPVNPKKTKPYSGKIDFDIAGTLQGNWFEVGTNGYAGPENADRDNSLGDIGYFSGHFSITPDVVYTENVNLSFGDYQKKPQQFTAIKGSIQPSEVNENSGIVKYELTDYKQPGLFIAVVGTNVKGTAVFQVLPNNKMKMEIFPNKTADQVTGFTGAEKTYER